MGNECAREFGIEETQIPLEESITGLVHVVGEDVHILAPFDKVADLNEHPDRHSSERDYWRKICILEWYLWSLVRFEYLMIMSVDKIKLFESHAMVEGLSRGSL
jgi:hypothetical protein